MGHHAPRRGRLTDVPVSENVYPPREIEPEALETGRLLFARECRFVAGAAEIGALPPETLPEIAFLGRSNVGKSSLVNALTGRRTLARTSNTPGRTRQLNFFALDERLMLVDLPGYGYAEASKTAIAAWTRLIEHYLRQRGTLRQICVLLDARHGLKPPDRPVMQLCDRAGLSFQIVLTKTDKLTAEERVAIGERVGAAIKTHTTAHPELHLTSAEKRLGIEALRATLSSFALPEPAAALASSHQAR
ncbi:MAG: YihA family ribosome biogenesis GTP-binding protein [Alphaproteobacteria bacterium]|nr:YihA family ribosome biogenesis GTP-binding protein [Alphaproteobacteria bacterium]